MRKLRIFGLVPATFLMLNVWATPAAWAMPTFTADGEVTQTEVRQVAAENEFRFLNENITCVNSFFDDLSTFGEGTSTFEVTPTYPECAAPKWYATVTHNSCKFIFTIGEFLFADEYSGQMSIVCKGKPIEVEIYTSSSEINKICTYTVGTQNIEVPIELTSDTGLTSAMDDITIESSAPESLVPIKMTREGSFCGFANEEASYQMRLTVKGYNELHEQRGLRLSGK